MKIEAVLYQGPKTQPNNCNSNCIYIYANRLTKKWFYIQKRKLVRVPVSYFISNPLEHLERWHKHIKFPN